MAFVKYYDEQTRVMTPPCIHLRSKAIYVEGQLKDVEHPDEIGAQYCWCNLTQHFIGPDQQHVTRPACVPERECYRESY